MTSERHDGRRHVLVLTPAYAPLVGGGERYAERYVQEIAGRDYRVTVLTSTARTQREIWQGNALGLSRQTSLDGVEVIRCPIKRVPCGWYGLSAWRKGMVLLSSLGGDHTSLLERMSSAVPRIDMAETLRSIGPVDLIHAYNISWEWPMMLAAREAKRRLVPLVVTPFAHLGTGPDDRVALNHTMQHQLAALRSADAVVALTDIESAGLEQLGVSPDRIRVLPAGIDPSPRHLPDKMDQSPLHPTVCFVGRNSPAKGAIQAIAAAEILINRGIDITLELAGPIDPACQRFLAKRPQRLRRHVVVHGILNEPDKYALIARSTMLLLPSRVDSFGIVILEAWQQARPVIGARAGGIPGLIHEGEDGLLVEHGDSQELAEAVAWLLERPEVATRMGLAGSARLAEFAWERLGEQLDSVYQDLCL